MLVSPLKITLNQFSRTVHVNFCRQNRIFRSRFTRDIVIRLKTTPCMKPSEPRLLTVLSDTLHPALLLNPLVSSISFHPFE
jgi:hypothetical protein